MNLSPSKRLLRLLCGVTSAVVLLLACGAWLGGEAGAQTDDLDLPGDRLRVVMTELEPFVIAVARADQHGAG